MVYWLIASMPFYSSICKKIKFGFIGNPLQALPEIETELIIIGFNNVIQYSIIQNLSQN